MKKPIQKSQWIWAILMLAVMVVIFRFSGQSGEISHGVSNQLAVWLFHMVGVEDPSAVKLLFGFTIRKWAHITAYATLGVTALGTFRKAGPAALVCYAYACLDEWHQSFVPGRGPAFTDTLIDGLGFGTVILVWLIVKMIWKKSHGDDII